MKTFDVFLAHNSQDKPIIELICKYLQKLGLNPWFDKQQIRPGNLFQKDIQATIQEIKCAAIFIGKNGLGQWQTIELEAFIRRCVKNNIQVIPVLLPGVEYIPENLIFLSAFHAVCFKDEIEKDFEAFKQLYWGIADNQLEIDITTFHELKSKVTPPSKADDLSSEKDIEIEKDFEAFKQLYWAIAGKPLEIDITTFYELKLTVTPPPKADDLSSEKDVDYTRLRDLLKAKNWYEADKETLRVMLQAVGNKRNKDLTSDEISKFPCTDLRTIDRLWLKYSNGHFGFSVQKQIYLDVHEDSDVLGVLIGWKAPGKDGGWKQLKDIYFDIEAKRGHLPWCGGKSLIWHVDGMGYFFSRIKTCKV